MSEFAPTQTSLPISTPPFDVTSRFGHGDFCFNNVFRGKVET